MKQTKDANYLQTRSLARMIWDVSNFGVIELVGVSSFFSYSTGIPWKTLPYLLEGVIKSDWTTPLLPFPVHSFISTRESASSPSSLPLPSPSSTFVVSIKLWNTVLSFSVLSLDGLLLLLVTRYWVSKIIIRDLKLSFCFSSADILATSSWNWFFEIVIVSSVKVASAAILGATIGLALFSKDTRRLVNLSTFDNASSKALATDVESHLAVGCGGGSGGDFMVGSNESPTRGLVSKRREFVLSGRLGAWIETFQNKTNGLVLNIRHLYCKS